MSDSRPDTPLASLDLLSQITDRHVVDQLLSSAELTRAEIAARTGISKPTISESIRRLEADGLVASAGQQQGRRGRAGTYYTLRSDLGRALALGAGPDGLVAEIRDVRGGLIGRLERETPSPITAAELNPRLLGLVEEAVAQASGQVLAAALTVAGPVDRSSGRLVRLPDSPFLVDELDPRTLLGPLLRANLHVDNDVNWAAVAEYHEGSATDLDDFCYVYLGHGIGGAVMWNGEPIRGGAGLAGEFAHVRTTGPGGRSMRLIECFGAWDLLQPGSSAIDVARLTTSLEAPGAGARRVRDAVVTAVAGAICSITAVLNPTGVIIGGPWSTVGGFGYRLTERVRESAVIDTDVRPAAIGDSAPLVGARLAAVRAAQRSLLQTPINLGREGQET